MCFLWGWWAEGGSQGTDQGTLERPAQGEPVRVPARALVPLHAWEGTCVHSLEEGKAGLGEKARGDTARLKAIDTEATVPHLRIWITGRWEKV